MIVEQIPVTINDQLLYFILEKPDNLLAWDIYYKNSPKIAAQILERKKISEVAGGALGFCNLRNAHHKGKEVYIAYMAKGPVHGDLCSEDIFIPSISKIELSEANLKSSFEKYFQHIVMSVGMITAPNSISTTHMGIIKNLLVFDDQKYSRLSLPLHSFAACWAYENGKRLQANIPIYKMVDILKKYTTHISEEHYNVLREKYPRLPDNYASLDHTSTRPPTTVFELSDLTPLFLKLSRDNFLTTRKSVDGKIVHNVVFEQENNELRNLRSIDIMQESRLAKRRGFFAGTNKMTVAGAVMGVGISIAFVIAKDAPQWMVIVGLLALIVFAMAYGKENYASVTPTNRP